MLSLHPLTSLPEICAGDDLAALLAAALRDAQLEPDGRDILVVTQKIVSKAEGRFVDLAAVTPGEKASDLAATTHKDARLVELILAESSAVIRAAPHVLITRHRSGHVMANAGIDQSNLGPGDKDRVLLLPEDADASAAFLRAGLASRFAAPPAIVIADSFGRPWRMGTVNVAIGAAGIASLWDRRGEPDRDGRAMEVTQIALADMIASAAGLAGGEGAEGIAAVLMRGLAIAAPERPAADLLRPVEQDLFT